MFTCATPLPVSPSESFTCTVTSSGFPKNCVIYTIRVELKSEAVELAETAVVREVREDDGERRDGRLRLRLDRGHRRRRSGLLQVLHAHGDPNVMSALRTRLRLNGFIGERQIIALTLADDHDGRARVRGVDTHRAPPRASWTCSRRAKTGRRRRSRIVLLYRTFGSARCTSDRRTLLAAAQ